MIAGNDLFYKCPKCGNLLSRMTFAMTNTFGLQLFSDMKEIMPNYPELPSISKCPKCNAVYWLDDETEIVMNKSETENVKRAEFLNIYEYKAVANSMFCKSEEDEVFVRKNIWWGFNDRIRKGELIFNSEADKALWAENAHRLSELLDFEDTDQRIMLAELCRNSGDFQECKDILVTITDPELFWVLDAYEIEIAKKNTMVFQLI